MAIALVAAVSLTPVDNQGGTTAAITTTGATLLVASTSQYNGFSAVVTVSDSKGNTWTGLTKHTSGNGDHRLFYCLTPTVGTGHTFTFGTGGTYVAATVYAFSGVGSYQTEGGAAHSDTPPAASGSVTPSADGALVVAGLGGNGAATDTVTPGFGTVTTIAAVGGTNMQSSAAWLVQTTAAAINPTWSWTGGSHTWVSSSTAVFLPSAEAGGGTGGAGVAWWLQIGGDQ